MSADAELAAVRLRVAQTQREMFVQERDDLANQAERLGMDWFAAAVRDCTNGTDLWRVEQAFAYEAGILAHDDWLQAQAVSKPPKKDAYADMTGGCSDPGERLARIGDRPGHLIGTLRSQCNVMARTRPALATRALAVLDGLDPDDRSRDFDLVDIRCRLGRAEGLGWPARRTGIIVSDLEALR